MGAVWHSPSCQDLHYSLRGSYTGTRGWGRICKEGKNRPEGNWGHLSKQIFLFFLGDEVRDIVDYRWCLG